MKKLFWRYILISEIIAFGIVILSFLTTLVEGLPIINKLTTIGFYLLIFPPFITIPIFRFFPREGGVDNLRVFLFDLIFYSIILIVLGLIIYWIKNKK